VSKTKYAVPDGSGVEKIGGRRAATVARTSPCNSDSCVEEVEATEQLEEDEHSEVVV